VLAERRDVEDILPDCPIRMWRQLCMAENPQGACFRRVRWSVKMKLECQMWSVDRQGPYDHRRHVAVKWQSPTRGLALI